VDGGIFLLEVIQPDSDSVETATMKATTKLNLRADHTTASADVGDVGADDIVTVYPKDRYIGPNYVWLRNEANQWIAQVVIASGAVYLERVPLTVLNGTSSTDLKLASEYGPGFRSLFQKLPVSMDDMKWFYYFGNTVIAYKCRDKYNYGYAQGLHGGVDLGNKTSATIIAGVNGVVDLIETKSDSNRKVWVKTDNYYIIYQHVWNEKVSVGQTVTPDTPIAEVRPWSNGGLDHLHLEVRNSSKGKILNPLWMMPEAMCNAIIKKYPATGSAAFLPKFGKYLTPLDQPIITNVLAKPENYLVPVGFLNQAELDAIKYSC
jgi:murein DD-endopeptidase MepM/ murein hydrolase activator NlpD